MFPGALFKQVYKGWWRTVFETKKECHIRIQHVNENISLCQYIGCYKQMPFLLHIKQRCLLIIYLFWHSVRKKCVKYSHFFIRVGKHLRYAGFGSRSWRKSCFPATNIGKNHTLTLQVSDTALHSAFIKWLSRHAKEAVTTKWMTNWVENHHQTQLIIINTERTN